MEKLAGETLANLWSFAKFSNVFPHQIFPPYSSSKKILRLKRDRTASRGIEPQSGSC